MRGYARKNVINSLHIFFIGCMLYTCVCVPYLFAFDTYKHTSEFDLSYMRCIHFVDDVCALFIKIIWKFYGKNIVDS